jgi:hypothetical protein
MYKIGKKNFYVPHFGKQFIISDFDQAEEGEKVKQKIDNKDDFYRLSTLINRIIVSYIVKKYNIDELIDLVKKKEDNTSPGSLAESFKDNFDEYLKKEREKISSYRVPSHIKKRILKKSIAYFMLEKGYITKDEADSLVKDKDKRLKLPPPNIQKLMNKIFINKNKKHKIPDILTEYFSEFINKSDKITRVINI